MTDVASSELALIEPLRALEQGGALTSTGLELSDPDLTYEQWAAIGRYLGALRDLTAWALGDWLLRGERTFDGWEQAIEGTGRSEGTLRNYLYVSSRIARSRRRENLSFTHHREVAAMEPRDQVEWLEKAVAERWSSGTLRIAIRDSKAVASPEQPQWTPPAQQELLAAEQDAATYGHGFLLDGKRVDPTKVSIVEPLTHDEQPEIASGSSPSSEEAKPEPGLADAVRRLVATAQRTAVGDYYRVSREALDEVAALAGEEDGDLGQGDR